MSYNPENDPRYDATVIPDPGFWKLDMTYDAPILNITLLCTLCPPGSPVSFLGHDIGSVEEVRKPGPAQTRLKIRVARHHHDQHPEKLFLFTGAGWLRRQQIVTGALVAFDAVPDGTVPK